MTFLYITFVIIIIFSNILIAFIESIKPLEWIELLKKIFRKRFYSKIYALLLLLIVFILFFSLTQTSIFNRFRLLIWIFNFYILFSSVIYFFFSSLIRDSCEMLETQFQHKTKICFVYLDCFLRLTASLVLIAAMIK